MAATLTARVTNMNGQIVAEKRGGQHRVLNSDPLGNVVDVRDSAGTQLASYNFWPYGEVRTSTGAITNPWMFCGVWGYYNDGSTYYVRARTYRPDLTRWLTVDPLWPSQRAISYSCSPLLETDPSGLFLCQCRIRVRHFILERVNCKRNQKWVQVYQNPKREPPFANTVNVCQTTCKQCCFRECKYYDDLQIQITKEIEGPPGDSRITTSVDCLAATAGCGRGDETGDALLGLVPYLGTVLDLSTVVESLTGKCDGLRRSIKVNDKIRKRFGCTQWQYLLSIRDEYVCCWCTLRPGDRTDINNESHDIAPK